MYSYTIKDLENLSGIKAHTIRIWEQRYSFLKPNRTQTNIRVYSAQELKTILNVALLNKYGYKISHIDKMNQLEMNERMLSLNQQEAQLERIVNSLLQYMIDLDIESLEHVLDEFIAERGVEKTIVQIVFPFLQKIGILWLTNHINPAQEHLVSSIIRQKIIVGINSVKPATNASKSVLLFLPETEYHELSLLFMNYMLKCRGFTTIYMGCSISLDEVETVVNIKKPAYIYTHLTSMNAKFDLNKFILNASTKFPKTPVIISGSVIKAHKKNIPAPVKLLKSFSEVMDFIDLL